MAAITGGVPIGGFISPTDDNDTFPVTDPTFGLGSLRTVANTTERNNIPDQRREQGMLVFSIADQKYYKLSGGTENSNWSEFTVAGASAEFGITADGGTGFTLGAQDTVRFSGGGSPVTVIINNVAKEIIVRGSTATSLDETEDDTMVTNSFFTKNALIRTSSASGRHTMGVSLDMDNNEIVSGGINGGGF